jgi:predicted N-formylglutamate amidohydrolase
MHSVEGLLAPEEGGPVAIELEGSAGPFVFICEHASARLPHVLGTLGLSDETLQSHIAWDPGALDLARLLSAHFDSPLVYQRFSRLAYDCNRPPNAPGAMPEVSEIYRVPGNENLSADQRDARTNGLYRPFHAAVSQLIDRRLAAGLTTALVTVHSFTPIYFGTRRTVEVGILHDDDSRLADRMLEAGAHSEGLGYDLRRNAPYGPADGVTHTLKLHGISRGIENVMIEVANSLLHDQAGQQVMAGYLVSLLEEAMCGRDQNKKTSMKA